MEHDPPAFDDAALARLLGLDNARERAFAHGIVEAVGRLDRGLLQPPAPHPFAEFIAQGANGVGPLLTALASGDPQKQRNALDALSHILVDSRVPVVVQQLKTTLSSVRDPEIAALAAKTLAIAGDEEFLVEQTKRLADEDPGVVATAARLLGFGRFRKAAPLLQAMVSPDRTYESRWVIWALGELGDASALPALELALAHAFRVTDCLIAVGKIGQLTSIPHVTPHLVHGHAEQKDAAVRALAMILHRHREDAVAIAALRPHLVNMLEQDLADATARLSGSTRYFMLLCLARLGQKLDEARVKAYLGGTFAASAGRNVAALRTAAKGERSSRKTSPPRRPR